MILPGSAGWSRFLRIAAEQGERPALRTDSGSTSFADLAGLATAWATMPALNDVSPGDRVVIWSANSVPMAVAVLGCWARGAIPVLLGAQTAPRHLLHAVTQTDATLVAAAPADLMTARSTGRSVVSLGIDRDLPLTQPPRSRGSWQSNEPASIVFTSGSTGWPKGVVQSHATLQEGCDAVALSLGIGAQDSLLCGVPWAFSYGWGQLLGTILRGVPQVLPSGTDPLAMCDAIARHRPTVLAAVPALLAGLTHGVSGIATTDVSSIRLVTNAGSRIPPAVFQATLRWFPHADVALNYGLTETYRTTSLPAALARSNPDSIGRPIPGVAIALLDEDGQPARPGAVGEVVHRGAGVFLGYWGDGAATARVRRPDPLWRHPGVTAPPAVFTGDLGRLDADGLLHLVGRRDRQIKSMGVRVSPEEIEAILLTSGLLREAAVIAVDHPNFGAQITAVAVPSGPPSGLLAALKRHARQEMSPFMQPRHYHLVEALPRTANGKIDYPVLQARYAEEAARA